MKTIALFLLAAGMVWAEPGDANWKAEMQASMEQVKATYGDQHYAEATKIIWEWDQRARAGNWAVYQNSNKPMIYMQWEMQARAQETLRLEREAERIRLANERTRRFEAEERAKYARRVAPDTVTREEMEQRIAEIEQRRSSQRQMDQLEADISAARERMRRNR